MISFYPLLKWRAAFSSKLNSDPKSTDKFSRNVRKGGNSSCIYTLAVYFPFMRTATGQPYGSDFKVAAINIFQSCWEMFREIKPFPSTYPYIPLFLWQTLLHIFVKKWELVKSKKIMSNWITFWEIGFLFPESSSLLDDSLRKEVKILSLILNKRHLNKRHWVI